MNVIEGKKIRTRARQQKSTQKMKYRGEKLKTFKS
jgi:hypothetical protein